MTIANLVPGQLAQAVQPNPKCEGCLHYNAHIGQTGACVVGLRPWLCGEGDAPDMGYAPIASSRPSLPGSFAPSAQAANGGMALAPVPMGQAVLGDSHAAMVKALEQEFTALTRSTCPLHQSLVKSQGQFSMSYEEQPCVCRPVQDIEIAKALVPKLSNAERAQLSGQEVVAFVASVRSEGERGVPFAKSEGGEGSRGGHVVRHTRNGKPVYGPSQGLKDAVRAWSDKGEWQDRRKEEAHMNQLLDEHVAAHKDYTDVDHYDALMHHGEAEAHTFGGSFMDRLLGGAHSKAHRAKSPKKDK